MRACKGAFPPIEHSLITLDCKLLAAKQGDNCFCLHSDLGNRDQIRERGCSMRTMCHMLKKCFLLHMASSLFLVATLCSIVFVVAHKRKNLAKLVQCLRKTSCAWKALSREGQSCATNQATACGIASTGCWKQNEDSQLTKLGEEGQNCLNSSNEIV